MRRRLSRAAKTTIVISALLLVLVGIAAGAAYWWASTPLGPSERALSALEGSERVDVRSAPEGIAFVPKRDASKVGVLIYPGGRVDARSYAPLALSVAEEGYTVVLVPMRLNLAVLSPERGIAAMAAHPGVERWVIAGHSLGGTVACSFAANHPEQVSGLVLLAAYPSARTSLANLDMPAVSMVGSEDAIVDQHEIGSSLSRLPVGTQLVPVTGGNHAQFGSYGEQQGDGAATITPAEQEGEAANAILHVASRVERATSK